MSQVFYSHPDMIFGTPAMRSMEMAPLKAADPHAQTHALTPAHPHHGLDLDTHGLELDSPLHGPQASGTGVRKIRYNQGSERPYFHSTKQLANLVAQDRRTSLHVRLDPHIERGFFMADGNWTCYRRNYFALSISYSLSDRPFDPLGPPSRSHPALPCLVDVQGRGLVPVSEFMLGVMAQTSDGSKEIELIQHTAKRDKGDKSPPIPKACLPVMFDEASASMLPLQQTQQINYDRLQFKSATQNNGKRRAAQQYHVLFCELLARVPGPGSESSTPFYPGAQGSSNMSQDQIIRVASAESVPLVVRGRAPGHYSKTNAKGSNGDVSPGSTSAHSPPAPQYTLSAHTSSSVGPDAGSPGMFEWGYVSPEFVGGVAAVYPHPAPPQATHAARAAAVNDENTVVFGAPANVVANLHSTRGEDVQKKVQRQVQRERDLSSSSTEEEDDNEQVYQTNLDDEYEEQGQDGIQFGYVDDEDEHE